MVEISSKQLPTINNGQRWTKCSNCLLHPFWTWPEGQKGKHMAVTAPDTRLSLITSGTKCKKGRVGLQRGRGNTMRRIHWTKGCEYTRENDNGCPDWQPVGLVFFFFEKHKRMFEVKMDWWINCLAAFYLKGTFNLMIPQGGSSWIYVWHLFMNESSSGCRINSVWESQ